MDLHRNSVGRAKNMIEEDDRGFYSLRLPAISRDKMQDKMPLINEYFDTLRKNKDNTKSGMCSI